MIDHFIECIINDKEPLITGEEGMKSLQIVLAALESNETKQIISLKQRAEII